ncbi:PREDICTED: nucleolar protein 6-like [Priapulus caudatus]|uniref:Nucleolar protein 6 n=1 Tax=Priapulus caudatus TaxID=37621 RepID=A0ABM1DN80_PRICU|nr:PREDICTED: nucleolar protein 6-like [Priapulus caudatus]
MLGEMDDGAGVGTSFSEESEDETQLQAESAIHQVMKRKNDSSELQSKKKARISKSNPKLYKPPSGNELNQLKETENHFHSNLFKLQITELISEVCLKSKWKKATEEYLVQLKDALTKLPNSKSHEITDQAWLTKQGIHIPIIQKPYNVKGKFQFVKPENIDVVGGFPMDLCCMPDIHVDLAVEIPKECLQEKDFLNHRYLRKRALYLAFIASKLLEKRSLVKKLMFTYHHGNHMKPVLIITPEGKVGHHCTVRLHTTIPDGYYKMSRFMPSKNNIRSSWYKPSNEEEVSAVGSWDDEATPRYNNLVLADATARANSERLRDAVATFPGLRDAILLLKVWLRQRDLDQARAGFTGFIMSMFGVHLLAQRKINRSMNSYQVLRVLLTALVDSNWTKDGASLCPTANLCEFHDAYDVVFLDTSGCINLCANVDVVTYDRVKHEARLSIDHLNDCSVDGFEALFMRKMAFTQKFDHIFMLTDVSRLVVKADGPIGKLVDHCGDQVSTVLPSVCNILKQGLGKRVNLLDVERRQPEQWGVDEEPPSPAHIRTPLVFGLLLNQESSSSQVLRGPDANTAEAEEFRQFWGDKSELRRFQDGRICEAVVWPGSTIAEKRVVCRCIVTHLLQRHFGVDASFVVYRPDCLDALLAVPCRGRAVAAPVYGAGEEANVAIVRSLDALTKTLRSLTDLPLAIKAVQGTAAVFRYTEVLPPIPSSTKGNAVVKDDFFVPKSYKPAPPWVPTLKGKCLEKDGYVFRLQVAYHREVVLLKQVRSPDGTLRLQENDASATLEKQIQHLPTLTTAIHGVQQQHNSYGASCRLFKRWVSSQLLSDTVTEEALDLLAAFVYLHPAPYTVPSSPVVGFLRTLNLLALFDWKNRPMIINFNNQLTADDYSAIQGAFTSQRSTLAAMYIVTAYSPQVALWTRQMPSPQLLARLVQLAQAAAPTLEQQLLEGATEVDFKQIFRPPLEMYDVVIHLEGKLLPRRHHAVDVATGTRLPWLKPYTRHVDEKMPVLDFDPAQCYLAELRETYDAFALFFHDTHGGDKIGVLWKPYAFCAAEAKVSHFNSRIPVAESGGKLAPNVEAIIEDFATIGKGLVKTIDCRTEQWV